MIDRGSGRRPRVTLDQLHTFVTLARHEHAGRAAEALHLSQGAVSQQLQLLERTLKIPLFERRRRRLRLTDAGRRISEAAAAVLNDARAVEEAADALQGLEGGGVSIVATGVVVSSGQLPAWIASFLDRHPAVEISLRLANTAGGLAAVVDGSADCAVVGGEIAEEELETMVLARSELAVVVARGHPLAGVRATRSALSGHRYLAREFGSATEILAPSLLGDAYRSGPVMELGRLEVVRAAVLAGLGYAVMPVGVIAAELASGEMVVLPRRGRAVMQIYRAVRRRGLHTPAAAALWEHLRTASGER